jgi:hypothetical protein
MLHWQWIEDEEHYLILIAVQRMRLVSFTNIDLPITNQTLGLATTASRNIATESSFTKNLKKISNWLPLPKSMRLGLSTVLDAEVSGVALNTDKRETIKKFVESLNGKRTIQRILIANNGMAATKAINSMRQWAYNTFGRYMRVSPCEAWVANDIVDSVTPFPFADVRRREDARVRGHGHQRRP